LNDSRRTSEWHASLRLALDEVRAVFGDGDRFDNGKLRLIERRAGLKDLCFATDPSATAGREVQSTIGTAVSSAGSAGRLTVLSRAA
jgi:hypothetical protein